jgi:Domain of unknown function (DUF4276)
MRWLEVLVEGDSDVPTIREILIRKFAMVDELDFRIHPHKGRGKLPENPLKAPDRSHQGLLDQLPAKLRGYAKSLSANSAVLVVMDLDNDSEDLFMHALEKMLNQLPTKPDVMFRLAIEETESWLIADIQALKAAFKNTINTKKLIKIQPDAVVGAWEQLAKALGIESKHVARGAKYSWAVQIAPHLNFDNPPSPSLQKLIKGIEKFRESIPK